MIDSKPIAESDKKLESSILRGIDFLRDHQFANGEFNVYCAGDLPIQEWCAPDSSVFPTALVATNLLFLANHPHVEDILTKASGFLRREMHAKGLWSHFTSRHFLRNRCGPDADDTACVSIFLRTRGITDPLKRTKALLLSNRNAKGLFYTWFVTRISSSLNRAYWKVVLSEWKEPWKTLTYWRRGEATRDGIDAVVNANVLFYLGDIPETQPIIEHLAMVISSQQEAACDFWYQDPNVIYYFFSRNYFVGIKRLEAVREPIIKRILANRGSSGCLGRSVLETAMGVCSLINLNGNADDLHAPIRFLLDSQQADGAWPRWLMYFGGPKKTLGWGSEELTTGYCLEALARYRMFVGT